MSKTIIATALMAVVLALPAQANGRIDAHHGLFEETGRRMDKTIDLTRDYLRDSLITARVKKRLFKDEESSLFNIKVLTRNGVVIVNGEVPTEKNAAWIMGIVRSTPGVMEARDEMIVKYWDDQMVE